MKTYKTKARKLPGTSYAEIRKKALNSYQKNKEANKKKNLYQICLF